MSQHNVSRFHAALGAHSPDARFAAWLFLGSLLHVSRTRPVNVSKKERGEDWEAYFVVQAFVQLALGVVAPARPLGPDIGMTKLESIEEIPARYGR